MDDKLGCLTFKEQCGTDGPLDEAVSKSVSEPPTNTCDASESAEQSVESNSIENDPTDDKNQAQEANFGEGLLRVNSQRVEVVLDDDLLASLSSQIVQGDMLARIEANRASPTAGCSNCGKLFQVDAEEVTTRTISDYLLAAGGDVNEEPIVPQALGLLYKNDRPVVTEDAAESKQPSDCVTGTVTAGTDSALSDAIKSEPPAALLSSGVIAAADAEVPPVPLEDEEAMEESMEESMEVSMTKVSVCTETTVICGETVATSLAELSLSSARSDEESSERTTSCDTEEINA